MASGLRARCLWSGARLLKPREPANLSQPLIHTLYLRMDPSAILFLLSAPLAALALAGNAVVLSLALRDAFDATICVDQRVVNGVLTANQALASLLFGAAHAAAAIGADASLPEAPTIGLALSVALIALNRAACVARGATKAPLRTASSQRWRISAFVGAAWILAATLAFAPVPSPWRRPALALTQFAAPTLALMVAQCVVAVRLRKRRYAKTNMLLTLSVLHFVVGVAPPTVALVLPAAPAVLKHLPPIVAAAASPVVYGWLSKPIRKRMRRLAAGVAKLWTKGEKISVERRLTIRTAGAENRPQPQVFIVALPPIGTFV